MIQAVGYRACYIFWTGTNAQMREEVRNEFGKYSGCWGSENVKEDEWKRGNWWLFMIQLNFIW